MEDEADVRIRLAVSQAKKVEREAGYLKQMLAALRDLQQNAQGEVDGTADSSIQE